ncbi:HVCN1-like protein, partial [Mya arenaria]
FSGPAVEGSTLSSDADLLRFEHEEAELKKFVGEITPSDAPTREDIMSTTDLLNYLRKNDPINTSSCSDPNRHLRSWPEKEDSSFKRFIRKAPKHAGKRYREGILESDAVVLNRFKTFRGAKEINYRASGIHSYDNDDAVTDYARQEHFGRDTKQKRSNFEGTKECRVINNFVFSFQTDASNRYYLRSFDRLDKSTATEEDYLLYQEKYIDFQKVAHIIKYIGFAVLSVMVFEVLLKLVCLGPVFFRKKIEVFDGFIVTISFVIDVVFMDSKWYESGKDATTILVLLMPWRVVRIVNSFLITINHKHHIEMLTIRRAKKKVDIKLKKLRQLMLEMRHDIDLLIGLAKLKGATEPEIALFRIGKERDEEDVTVEIPKEMSSSDKESKKPKIRRRVTLPRRHKSCNDDEKQVYYINDGFDVMEEVDDETFARGDNRSVRSMPQIETTKDGKSILTFEFTTQVSYL